MLTRGPDSSCHDSNESPRQAGTRDRTADQAPAAFQQICSIPSYASAFKQPPTNSILGGASIAKDRRKQPVHHLESEGYPGVSKHTTSLAGRGQATGAECQQPGRSRLRCYPFTPRLPHTPAPRRTQCALFTQSPQPTPKSSGSLQEQARITKRAGTGSGVVARDADGPVTRSGPVVCTPLPCCLTPFRHGSRYRPISRAGTRAAWPMRPAAGLASQPAT